MVYSPQPNPLNALTPQRCGLFPNDIGTPEHGGYLLLADGTHFLLLADGVTKLSLS